MKLNLEQAHKILEENRQTYDNVADEFERTRRKYNYDAEELKEYIKQGEKVLDLGCGSGRMFEMFLAQDVDYTGVDFSEKLIEIAKNKYGDNFKVADILNLPFSNENFDSVWSIAVLHHIPSTELRKRVLSEIKRVLRPNGRVVVTCWNIKSLFRKDLFIPFNGQKRYYHVFSKREIGKLFKGAGFKIEEVRFLKRNNKKVNILVVAKSI
ncbi:MAG: class I SAM-dependent methyltransferase [Patescibacteria group bacterium]